MEILFPNDLDTVNNPCHFENFILNCTATPYCTLREQDPKHTVTEYIVLSFSLTFIAIQIAELLKCMLSHTGDLGSRLDTLDDIDTEKTVHIPKLLHCS